MHEMSDRKLTLRVVQTIVAGFLVVVISLLAFNTIQMHTMTKAGYCERFMGSGWVRCDLLKDVVVK